MKWNAELYDDKHSFVFQYGENVLELLGAKSGERILDLGCGTGYLTHQIKEQGAIVTGIDASPDMIAKAKKTYPDVKFSVADGANFHFDDKFDAVFSNATLHWIKNVDAVIKSVYDSLKPGGRFVAEMGGKGNVKQLIAATRQVLRQHGYDKQAETEVWYFPSLSEYTSRLEAHGFRVTYAAHFDRKTPLQDGDQGVAKWITMFAPLYLIGVPKAEKQQMLTEVTALLEPYYNENGQWYADYKRLRFIAIKE
ncbi:methyltransferase domain-containing protein [Mucilaginibacter segetis]|uniref:Methyltransferase domain-containing protein n=1 Tax=Mucilaginibacter segetis TaxID=2793071 RepID=A0A934PR87_9SPHI|nr:methyltransferase domain-containing protein [Mucilaginibacter segetis]MBK0378167.1 methyltransferase domain-containing protein [Mucilaginibacter segetis]